MNKLYQNSVYEKIHEAGIIPVLSPVSAEKAVELCRQLESAGCNAVEIAFRTAAAAESIAAVKKALPSLLVGAGTVINPQLAAEALSVGAEFIVAPGFNPETVDFVLSKKGCIIPGVSNAGQIEQAVAKGLSVLKFFPAESSGGVETLKAFSGPFPNVKFLPTGGINAENMTRYLRLKNVIAVAGTWMMKGSAETVKADMEKALLDMHGFAFGHLGINSADKEIGAAQVDKLKLFGFLPREIEISWFCEKNTPETPACFEIMKAPGAGTNGHICIKTWDIERALAYLRHRNIFPDMATALYTGEKEKSALKFVYVTFEIAGFAVHLSRA